MKRSGLASLHESRGAVWISHHGWEIPAAYSSVEQEYRALQEGAGLLDLSCRGRFWVTGRDRRSWLHGQVTQDVKGLPDGRGAYATILTPQGQMVSDARIFALPDRLLVDYPAGTATPLSEYLDRYLIMERAEIEDVTEPMALLSLQGPLSPCALAPVLGEEVLAMQPWEVRVDCFRQVPLVVARVGHCGEDGFDLFVPASAAADLWVALCHNRKDFAVHSVGWEALNVRRIEAGIPWWGEDLAPNTGPMEARLNHAIHMSKGCYTGQEIIARIDARGHVNNLLTGFLVEGNALPLKDAEIWAEGKKVGRVTSAVRSLRLDRGVTLGYLRRELQDVGTRVIARTGAGEVALTVTPLPFVPDDFPPASPCPPPGQPLD